MTFSVWLWWQGYLTVRLEGPGLEHLLNELAKAEIPLWNVRRLTLDVMIINIPVASYYKIRPLLWGGHIKISILDRHGFPFLFAKLKKRAFWGVGLLIALLIMTYLSSFVWFIEITGNEQISAVQLGAVLKEYGLKMGTLCDNVEQRQLETALLTRFPDLVWAEIDRQGVKVVVRVAEREIRPGEEQRIGNICAKQDGLITEVLVLRGTPLVQEGNTVREGEPLISGQYYDQRGKKQMGAARGIILARVWYQGVGEASFTHWEPVQTGVTKVQFLFTLGPLTLPLGKSRDLANHTVFKQTWSLQLGQALLPLEWTKIKYSEVEYVSRSLPLEEVRKNAFNLAKDQLIAQGVDWEKVQEQWIEEVKIMDDEGIHLTLRVEVEVDIGHFLPQ